MSSGIKRNQEEDDTDHAAPVKKCKIKQGGASLLLDLKHLWDVIFDFCSTDDICCLEVTWRHWARFKIATRWTLPQWDYAPSEWRVSPEAVPNLMSCGYWDRLTSLSLNWDLKRLPELNACFNISIWHKLRQFSLSLHQANWSQSIRDYCEGRIVNIHLKGLYNVHTLQIECHDRPQVVQAVFGPVYDIVLPNNLHTLTLDGQGLVIGLQHVCTKVRLVLVETLAMA